MITSCIIVHESGEKINNHTQSRVFVISGVPKFEGGERIERHTLVQSNDILMRNRMGLMHIYIYI